MTENAAESTPGSAGSRTPLIAVTWAWVGLPFLYGVYSLVIKLPNLF